MNFTTGHVISNNFWFEVFIRILEQKITDIHTSSVLYIPIMTPPVPMNSNTSVVNLPPLSGVKEISKVPGPFTAKSLARYYENDK